MDSFLRLVYFAIIFGALASFARGAEISEEKILRKFYGEMVLFK